MEVYVEARPGEKYNCNGEGCEKIDDSEDNGEEENVEYGEIEDDE